MRILRISLVGLLAVAFSGACGGTSSPASRAAVSIDTFMFKPKALQVRVGDTVTWTNADAIVHTVTSGTRDYDPADSGKVLGDHKSGLFDAPLDGKGKTFSHTFAKAGAFHYFCDRHPGMEADITVT